MAADARSLVRWSNFAAERPELAEAGRALIYQYRVGLGYLATVRKDGGPRVHPVCPVIANDGLYVFIGNHSPKLHDLQRDGRYALHSFPHPNVDDEFAVSGRAVRVDERGDPPSRVRGVHGDRRDDEQRHVVRAPARARAAREVRAATELATGLHDMEMLVSDARCRIDESRSQWA
jgi:hypothetical protein